MINVLCFEMSKHRDNQSIQISRQHSDMAGQFLESFGERDTIIPPMKSAKLNPLQLKRIPCVDIHFQELSQVLTPLSAAQWLWGSPSHPGLLTHSTNPAGVTVTYQWLCVSLSHISGFVYLIVGLFWKHSPRLLYES